MNDTINFQRTAFLIDFNIEKVFLSVLPEKNKPV